MITWLWLLTGCWDPTVTGPSGMVGRVLDASGAPVVGHRIETLEAEQETGPEGQFALQYKAPNQLVHFHEGGLWYKRLYRPEDDGKQVEIRLSEVAERQLECGPCTEALELEWTLAPGLVVSEKLRCGKDTEVVVPLSGTLSRSMCRGKGETELEIELDEQVLRVLAPPRSLRVELAPEGELPASCEVRVGKASGALRQPGLYEVSVRSPGWVEVSCEGRPAVPVAFTTEESVSVPWSSMGWELRSNDAFQADGLHLTNGTWWMHLTPQQDGTYLLPPVGPGRYGVVLSSEPVAPVREGWTAASEPDAL